LFQPFLLFLHYFTAILSKRKGISKLPLLRKKSGRTALLLSQKGSIAGVEIARSFFFSSSLMKVIWLGR
jgi:hypothetical protein